MKNRNGNLLMKTDMDNFEKHKFLSEILKVSGIKEIYLDEIEKYLDLLILKNKELNLISRKMDTKTIIYDHFFDCVAAWNFFDRYSSITDLGSGGGLPGILLAIVFPEKKITLIEKSPKKYIFLREAVKKVGLKNVELINGLVGEQEIAGDAVTCRAFKSIAEIISMTQDFFLGGGNYILYKGRKETIDDELNEAGKKYRFGQETIKINLIMDKERYMVIINRRI